MDDFLYNVYLLEDELMISNHKRDTWCNGGGLTPDEMVACSIHVGFISTCQYHVLLSEWRSQFCKI